MDDKKPLAEKKPDRTEGCMNCEFIEYRDGIRNYCSEHERYVKDCDPPCKAYVEEGSY